MKITRKGTNWGIDELGNRSYMTPKWTKHFIYVGNSFRIPKWYYKPIYFFANLNVIRYKIDSFLNLFDYKKGKTVSKRWNYWGGGGKINMFIRKYITHD